MSGATRSEGESPARGLGVRDAARGGALASLMLAGVGLLALLAAAIVGFSLAISKLLGPGRDPVTLPLLVMAACVVAARFAVPAILVSVRRLAILTRQLAGRWAGVRIADPYRPPRAGVGPLRYSQRMDWLLTDPATWRDLLWLIVNACVGWVLALAPLALAAISLIAFIIPAVSHAWPPAVFPGNTEPALVLIGGAMLAFGLWLAPWLLRAHFVLAAALLRPSGQAELALRVSHLSQTRAQAIDTSAAEMRRIERDLHDGAQARLVAMGLALDAAGRMIDQDPAAARALLYEARDSSARALAELRDLVRGIHPPVLADRGLAEAVRALALDSPLPVTVTGGLPARPAAPVESAAYFAVSELLTNVAKHAQASRAQVDMRHESQMLRISVWDDGRGGADPAAGTGLLGIERRLAAFDGVLAVASPAGGPTVVTMELPCEL